MKNLKTFVLIVIALVAVSCKKDKQNSGCTINSIYSENDSTILTYNANGQPINNTLYFPTSPGFNINFRFSYSTGNCGIQVTSPISSFLVNYQLNSAGNIIACADSFLSSGHLLKNAITCRYNANNQIVFSEVVHYNNGVITSSSRDSFAYVNENLSRKYHYKKSGALYYQDGYFDIDYSTQTNKNDFLVTERYLINDVIISSHFGGGMPYVLSGLFGKGSKNEMIKITEYNNAGEVQSTINLMNEHNGSGTISKQKYVNQYTAYSNDSSIVNYRYSCN